MKNNKIKLISVILFAIIAVVFATPFDDGGKAFGKFDLPNNAFTNWLKSNKVNLGLDLKGGTQLEYKIDLSEVEAKDRDAIKEGVKNVIERRVNKLGVSEPNIYVSEVGGETHIIVELAGIKDEKKLDANGNPVLDEDGNEIIIKGVDRAKEVVGKVIQLEFKTEAKELSDEELEKIKKRANTSLEEIKNSPDNFEEIVEVNKGVYSENDFTFNNKMPNYFRDKLIALNPGDVLDEVVEGSDIKIAMVDGQQKVVQEKGLYLARVLEKEKKENDIKESPEDFKKMREIFYGGDFQKFLEEKELEKKGEEAEGSENNTKKEGEETKKDQELNQDLIPEDIGEIESGKENEVLSTPDFNWEENDLSNVQDTGKGFRIIKKIAKNDYPEKVQASHVLISYKGAERAAEDVTRTKEEAKARAQEVLDKAKAGEDFAELAKEYSDGPTGEKGGDLGFFARDSMVKPFSDAAFSMGEGEISDIVETDFGFHIIKKTGFETAGPSKYEFSEITICYTGIEGCSSGRSKEDAQDLANKIIEFAKGREYKREEDAIKYETGYWSTSPSGWKETGLTGKFFKRADVKYQGMSVNPEVSILFDDEGAKLFEKLTEENVGKRIAIFVGGELISSPRVNGKISGGSAVITGNFTTKEAAGLARDLNTGAIPAPIKPVGDYTIGATLGKNALNKSLFAGFLGIVLLALYLIANYRLPGFFAVISLFIYAVLMVCTWKIFGVVITLAGVAGVILSIGMAVDANVLIFERFKEEIMDDRTYSASVVMGFRRAWSSIRDSNVSGLITCAILFFFGTSIIKGFALTLGIGILISMFSAIYITRIFMDSISSSKMNKSFLIPGINAKKSNFDLRVIKKSKIWLTFSSTLVALSLICIIIFGLNFGMDFTGGNLLEVKIANQASTQDIKDIVKEIYPDLNPVVVKSGDNNFILRFQTIKTNLEDKNLEDYEVMHDEILAKFNEKLGKAEEVRFFSIGPTVSSTTLKNAVLSILIAIIAIILYISWAFRDIPKRIKPYRFAISAIIALVHDVVIVLGAFAIFGRVFNVEIDTLFITAELTILGFSVNDTIVVFDRIRENLRKQKSRDSFGNVANISLNETLTRSVNTSLTTLFTLLALVLFGSDSIHWFSLALLLGVVVGTYSSIFLATPFLVKWHEVKRK